MRDTSLYLDHGEHGKVVDVKVFSREDGDKLVAGRHQGRGGDHCQICARSKWATRWPVATATRESFRAWCR